MRPLLTLALLLPALASANPQWLLMDGYEGSSMGASEIVAFSYMAAAVFALFAYQCFRGKSWRPCAGYLLAAIGAVAFPQLFGVLAFVAVTVFIILIGIGH